MASVWKLKCYSNRRGRRTKLDGGAGQEHKRQILHYCLPAYPLPRNNATYDFVWMSR